MKRGFFTIIIMTVSFLTVNAQQAEIIKYPTLDKLIKAEGEHVEIINFWATWCGPCIKELPYFEALPEKLSNRQLNVTLISLDFADKLDRVNAFIERKNITSEVLLLDEIDYNSWIDRVSTSWSGAIPATLLVDKSTGRQKFIEGEIPEGELENIISEFLN